MWRLLGALALILGLAPAAAEAADDVTGIWTIAGQPSAKLLIERQADLVKIAVTGATELGLRYAWYAGEGAVVAGGPQSLRLDAVRVTRDFGVLKATTRVLDRATLTLTLIDAFRGTLSVGSRSFDVERKELVANGLIAALDADAPETGWYAAATDGEIDFFEGQGQKAFVLRLNAFGAAPTVTVVEATKSAALTWTGPAGSVTAQRTAAGVVAFGVTPPRGAPLSAVRTQFAKRAGAFVEDLTATAEGLDADGNGVRDDIDVAIGDGAYASSRLRDGLTEIARAYRVYLAAPSQTTALEALERVELAKTCLAELAPADREEPVALVESLLFNTTLRFLAEQDLTRTSGPRLIEESSVALRDPNDCATFMQGVTRRYDRLTRSEIRRAQASPAPASEERAMSRARRAESGPRTSRAAAASNKCANTRILLVTGIITNQTGANDSKDLLEKVIKSSNIDSTDFRYAAYADRNPGAVNDIFQFITGSLKTTPRQASDLIRSGFVFIFVGRVLQKLSPTPAGIGIGSFLIKTGDIAKIVGKYAEAAIVDNQFDEQELSNIFSNDVINDIRVIAVSHSRGNLRSNSAYSMSDPRVRNSVAIASIANAARRVASGGTGATRSDDDIITLTRLFFGSERKTFRNAGLPRDFFTGHFLDKSYLNNAKARDEILLRIKAALATAQVTPSGSNRVLAQSSGGFTGLSAKEDDYKIGKNGVTFSLNYQAFSIPDRFDVIYRGAPIASTGSVSGSGTLNVRLPADPNDPTDGDVIVAVYGPDPGTAWNYEVVCPSSASPALALR